MSIDFPASEHVRFILIRTRVNRFEEHGIVHLLYAVSVSHSSSKQNISIDMLITQSDKTEVTLISILSSYHYVSI